MSAADTGHWITTVDSGFYIHAACSCGWTTGAWLAPLDADDAAKAHLATVRKDTAK